jgi:hypothetical protein
LSLDVIKQKALLAQVHWSLEDSEFYDCTLSRRVCVKHLDGIPASFSLNNVFTSRARPVAPGDCVDLQEGRYELASTRSDISCEIKVVSIYADDAPLSLDPRCAIRLGGTWRTPEGETLLCSEPNPGLASCSGLSGLGLGFLTASLNARGTHALLTGTFYTGAYSAASGELTWKSGTLVGQIRRTGYPAKEVTLRRVDER